MSDKISSAAIEVLQLENKILKTREFLTKKMDDADQMILHYTRGEARKLLKEIIEPDMFVKENQTHHQITTQDHIRIRVFLARMADVDRSGKMSNDSNADIYEKEKELCASILHQLSL